MKDENKQNNENKYNFTYHDTFIMLEVILNGIATGNALKTTAKMVNNGYDNIDMTCLVLWLALMGHTIKRIIQIQRDKNNNQKQR